MRGVQVLGLARAKANGSPPCKVLREAEHGQVAGPLGVDKVELGSQLLDHAALGDKDPVDGATEPDLPTSRGAGRAGVEPSAELANVQSAAAARAVQGAGGLLGDQQCGRGVQRLLRQVVGQSAQLFDQRARSSLDASFGQLFEQNGQVTTHGGLKYRNYQKSRLINNP